MPRKEHKDLNKAELEVDSTFPWEIGKSWSLLDNSTSSEKISVYFKDIEINLIRELENWNYVVGNVYNFTSWKILDKLRRMKAVGIVIDKCNNTRLDLWPKGEIRDKKRRTLRKMQALRGFQDRKVFKDTVLEHCTMGLDFGIAPVRCVGFAGEIAKREWALMHNKFLVFLDDDLQPMAAWTGSFNFSQNATRSLENAVYIEDPIISKAFFQEWAQIEAIAEPLDWLYEGIKPELTLGVVGSSDYPIPEGSRLEIPSDEEIDAMADFRERTTKEERSREQ